MTTATNTLDLQAVARDLATKNWDTGHTLRRHDENMWTVRVTGDLARIVGIIERVDQNLFALTITTKRARSESVRRVLISVN